MTLELKSFPDYDLNSKHKKAFEQFKATIEREEIGFFHVNEREELLSECEKTYQKFANRKYFVHVGIGGSSLGPEMLVKALGQKDKAEFIFFNNIDPDHIHQELDGLNPEECLFYFVSKSGGTAETMACLSLIINYLSERGIDHERLKDYFVFATDPLKSDLLKLGQKLDITCLEVPSNVGGRFCALTPVGYLPALFAGISPQKLNEGAQEIKPSLLNPEMPKNLLMNLFAPLAELYEQGIDQTVLMPYSTKLKELSSWFVQLWAESLGKKYDLQGKLIHKGLTPLAAYGATDQHSQMQLFMEGPKNKALIMVEVAKTQHDFALKNDLDLPAFKALSAHKLSELMKAEFYGTLKALKEAERPFFHLQFDALNEKSLGALILTLESLTVIMGHYLDVDPFDQPGVEAGKRYAFEWLGKQN